MAVVVQKYGGTSVAGPERIKAVAGRVETVRRAGNDVVVVVSAMGSTTDELLGLARQITDRPPPRELDMLLTAGERISMALLAMALDSLGVPAVSYTGSQAGILTDSSHGEARIREVTGQRVRQSLDEGKVVIVAGFQGVDPDRKEVTTLGRGGSDTTAVALAAFLGAQACEIYTDVGGVYTADPRLVPDAVKLDEIGYHEMEALAAAGATVLMTHSVEFAHQAGVPVHVRSSFDFEAGTWVRGSAPMHRVAGLAHRRLDGEGVVSIVGAGAADAADDGVAALEAGGIAARRLGVDGITATLWVQAELLEDAVRLLHRTLEPPGRMGV